MWILFLLIFGHFLADYPLQGDFLAQAKNRNTNIGKLFWKHALSAHAYIHAGMVGLILGLTTGNHVLALSLAFIEFVVHGCTDFLKCEEEIDLNFDQLVHIACKFLWAGIAAAVT